MKVQPRASAFGPPSNSYSAINPFRFHAQVDSALCHGALTHSASYSAPGSLARSVLPRPPDMSPPEGWTGANLSPAYNCPCPLTMKPSLDQGCLPTLFRLDEFSSRSFLSPLYMPGSRARVVTDFHLISQQCWPAAVCEKKREAAPGLQGQSTLVSREARCRSGQTECTLTSEGGMSEGAFCLSQTGVRSAMYSPGCPQPYFHSSDTTRWLPQRSICSLIYFTNNS